MPQGNNLTLQNDADPDMHPVIALSRDLRKAASTLSATEARFLVDMYYQMQGNRIRSANQIRSLRDSGEPHAVLAWLSVQSEHLEKQIRSALNVYSKNHVVGEWLHGVKGVGPVIAAGMLAHIDINKAPTVGHIWRYAGLDPTSTWNKGEKRPWNAALKVVCWKLGESFVKVSGNEEALYGKMYKERKELEQKNNDNLVYVEQAKQILLAKKIGKDTDAYAAYSKGKLPPAHIHARAKRYAVKQFLADLHGEMYRKILGQEPPLPYPIAILGHAHVRR